MREPQFRTFAEQVHTVQVALADEILGENVPDPAFRRWATRTVVGYINDSVLAWLEVGDPGRDEEFVQRATDGLVAMFVSWAGRGYVSRGLSSAATASSSSRQPIRARARTSGSTTNFDAPASTISSMRRAQRRQARRG